MHRSVGLPGAAKVSTPTVVQPATVTLEEDDQLGDGAAAPHHMHA
jgi:hypothetical protein